MNKLEILKRIKLDAKTNIPIEELECVIDSFFNILTIELDKNENLNFGDWLHLSAINDNNFDNSRDNPYVNHFKPKWGPIPGIYEKPDIIGNLGKGNRSINKFKK